MKRVLQITILMIGVLLIVISAEMTRRRDRHDDTEILLMTAIRDGHDSVYLVGAATDVSAWRAIGPEYAAFSPKGRSPDGKWVYLMESDYNNHLNIPYAENMRVRTNGTQAQRLEGINASSDLFWSADGVWVYYQFYDVTVGQTDLLRAVPDTGIVENLTANFQWSVSIGQFTPPIIDPHNDWIIFSAADLQGLNGVFRLDLRNGQITNLLSQTSAYVMLLGRSANGAWLVIRIDDVLYHVRPDGSDLEPIFANQGGYATVWGSADLILANVYQTDGTTVLTAVAIEDGQVYWRLPNVYPDAYPSQPTIFLRDLENRLYLARADRTQPRLLLSLPSSTLSAWPSPQNDWLMVLQGINDDTAPNLVIYVLWGLRQSDGALVELFRSPNYFSVTGWSVDEKAVFVEWYDNGKRDLWRIELADGTKTRLLHGERYGYFLGVVGERNWGAWVCVPIGGVGLIGAVVGSWVWGRRKRPG